MNCKYCQGPVTPDPSSPNPDRHLYVETCIVVAAQRERDRCAAIAEAIARRDMADKDGDKGRIGLEIVKAIREQ